MFDDILPHNDVALRILRAADVLMAREGVQNLSTHKVAKEAGVSVGTIYLYFKDKEALLNQLVMYLFREFHQFIESRSPSPDSPLFEQYRQLWRATWEFIQNNPSIAKNMHQYESIPSFQQLVLECSNSEKLNWNRFIKQGQVQGVIAPLPSYVLIAMSMKVVWELTYMLLLREETLSDEVIDEVISRTWKAIIL